MKLRAIFVTIVSVWLFFGGLVSGGDIVGKKAPEMVVRQWLTGVSLSNEDLDGRVYAVEFWATWCGPCVKNIPHLIELNEKYGARGLELIALSQDNSAEKVRRLIYEKGVDYHVAIDNGTVNWFGVRAYPTAFVVNHEGIVVWEGFPWDSGFEEAIEYALKKAPPPFTAGIDIKPFGEYRQALFGGEKFAAAYEKLRFYARGGDEKAKLAGMIVESIDRGIGRKILAASALVETEPVRAYMVYKEMLSLYGGIEVCEPAKAAFEKLSERGLANKGLLAAAIETGELEK